MTTFNRITSSIEQLPTGWFRIRLRYWCTDHEEFKEEVSARVFASPIEAEQVAIEVAHRVKERLGG